MTCWCKFNSLAQYLPLAIGIKTTLLELATNGELGMTPAELVQVMTRHCAATRYLKSLANDGAYRHDLDGKPVCPVADGHRTYAIQGLLAREKKRKQ